MQLKELKTIYIPDHLLEMIPYFSEIYEQESQMIAPLSSIKLSNELSKCLDKIPSDIHGLKDGMMFRFFELKVGQEAVLGALGFKLNIGSVKKAMIVEIFQTGSHNCDEKIYNYGVGARFFLQVKSKKFGAKLDSPQQITASVIFGKASVTYEWRTFGLTGAGIEPYIGGTGELNENSYNNFVHGMHKIFADAYKNDKKIIVFPQPILILD